MPDPQPSAAAKRLIDAQDAAVREHLRSVNMQFGATLTHERERSIRTLALDDAGVRVAVEKLEYAINFKSPTSDKITLYVQLSGCHKVFVDVLAALTGDDDAT